MTERIFDGRTALVTGGARGIGRACCERLARAGAKVAINYHTRDEEARKTARLVESAGSTAHVVGADVAVPAEVEAMIAEVTEKLGPIDLLVNNAGVFEYVPHTELTYELWHRTLEVNLTGTYLVTWAVKDGMVERGFGRIVNMSSIAGLVPRPLSIAYSASKAAMIGFTRSLAVALAPHNVRVNAVAPGLIDTEILNDVASENLEKIIAATPIPRIGRPEEIAATVLFLLSEESSFTTGQTLVASGGRVTLP